MSYTFHLACDETRCHVWIGQGETSAAMTTLYTGEADTMAALMNFLNDHKSKSLRFVESSEFDDYREYGSVESQDGGRYDASPAEGSKAHDRIVTSEVNKLIGDSLCPFCGTGFLSQAERDEAVAWGRNQDRWLYAHGVCWNEKEKETRRIANLQRHFEDVEVLDPEYCDQEGRKKIQAKYEEKLERIIAVFNGKIDRYARRATNEPTTIS